MKLLKDLSKQEKFEAVKNRRFGCEIDRNICAVYLRAVKNNNQDYIDYFEKFGNCIHTAVYNKRIFDKFNLKWNDRTFNEFGYLLIEMKPLKKPFSVSETSVQVSIQGHKYTVANLLKSGITNQSTVLLAVDDVWHQVNVLNLGGDNSNIFDFKTHVELHNYTLKDFGILVSDEKTKTDYTLKHDDFMELESKYPCFSYIYISKLNDHLIKTGGYSGKYGLNQALAHIQKMGYTIQDYIKNSELNKQEIIKNGDKSKLIKMKDTQNERTSHLLELGFVYDESKTAYISRWGTMEAPASFEVSLKSISDDTDEEWEATLERIAFNKPTAIDFVNVHDTVEAEITHVPAETHQAVPITETPAPEKKPVSIATIGSMQPSRILEFQKIKETQEQIVKDNPVVTITDAESLKKAEATAKILLKASTNIDAPKTGILGTFVTHANQFIKMGKDYLEPIAKMTRDPYNKQKTLIDAYKSAEELRKQKEAKEKLEKIQNRTNQLFAVPMVFNGSQYIIGTLYILPSQIETATDEQFSALVEQAKGIKTAQDEAQAKESEKDALIKQLQEQLAALTAPAKTEAPAVENTAKTTVTAPNNPDPVAHTQNTTAPVNTPIAPAQTASPAPNGPAKSKYIDVFSEANPDNKILLALDLENVSHVNNPNFVKCRSFYIRGTLDLSAEIRKIFASESTTKAADIRSLLDIIEKEKCYV